MTLDGDDWSKEMLFQEQQPDFVPLVNFLQTYIYLDSHKQVNRL